MYKMIFVNLIMQNKSGFEAVKEIR